MVVAERADADAAEQVEVLGALLVVEVHAFAAGEEDGIAFVGRKEELAFGGLQLGEIEGGCFSGHEWISERKADPLWG